jgi:hypothetical protein
MDERCEMTATPLPSVTQAPPATRPLRVVQWDTGNIGIRSLQAVIEHPNLTLVGVYVHSPAKAGRDAGELCGLEPTGVLATRDLDEIVKLKADCVVYMSRALDLDEVCTLLASGTNIVTTCSEFHRPNSLAPAIRERVEAACIEGGTSIHSTGISPGFITEAVPLVLTSVQRRLEHIWIDEYADLSQRNSPEMLFDIMGFGHPTTDFDQRRIDHVAGNFGPSLELLAEALSLPLDSVVATGEIATARHTTEIAAGTLEAGTLAGQRITIAGMKDGEQLLRFRANWFCTTDLDPEWDVRSAGGWHVSVAGDVPMEVAIVFPFGLDQMAAIAPGLTANPAVNAVAAVCAAAPGIRSTMDLPHRIATLG